MAEVKNFIIGDVGSSFDKRVAEHTLIGEKAHLIKFKSDLDYREFFDDPFGKVKLAKKEESRLY